MPDQLDSHRPQAEARGRWFAFVTALLAELASQGWDFAGPAAAYQVRDR